MTLQEFRLPTWGSLTKDWVFPSLVSRTLLLLLLVFLLHLQLLLLMSRARICCSLMLRPAISSGMTFPSARSPLSVGVLGLVPARIPMVRATGGGSSWTACPLRSLVLCTLSIRGARREPI